MIKTIIFKKARKLLDENRISIVQQTANKVLFRVDSNETHYVVIKQNHAVTYECDCEFYLRKAREGRNVMCSHVLACLIFMFNQIKKEKKDGGGGQC